MEKSITAAIASVLALGAVQVGQEDASPNGERPSARHVLAESGGPRNLVLKALGAREPGADQLRIPVPGDDSTYEVIIEKPGTPKSVLLAEDANNRGAISSGRVVIASDEEVANLEKQVRGWAAAFYPGLLAAKRLPDDLILGFLLDKAGNVERHSVGFQVEGERVEDELVRLLPGSSRSQIGATGGICLAATEHEPKYCVVYGYLR